MTRTTIKKKFDDAAGKICEAVIPVRHERFEGAGGEAAICTLGSIDLLEEISKSPLMTLVAIAGRLLSENRGIDAIIQFALSHPELKMLVLCGREVKGHMAGQALLSLYKNGVDPDGRIIGARGPYPSLQSSRDQVEKFRAQVCIIDLVGVTDLKQIARSIA